MQRVAPLLLVPALLAACAERANHSQLADSSWRFELIDGQRPSSSDATVQFQRGKIGVEVGCNRLGGPWRMDDNRLVAGPLAQSEVACSEPSWDQESAVSALLVATPRVVMDGDRMTIQSSGHTAELVRIDAAPSGD